MKLLIVDDSSLIRKTISAVYKNTIFTEIQTASDGMLAVTMFEKFLPDVVTLDITMPHMDGLSALTQMLSIKPNTFILTISALADHHTAIESLKRGAHQFICKPFSPSDLKEALDFITEAINEESSEIKVEDEFHSRRELLKGGETHASGYVAPPVIVNERTNMRDHLAQGGLSQVPVMSVQPMPLRPPQNFGR